jgi:hypothetical protein
MAELSRWCVVSGQVSSTTYLFERMRKAFGLCCLGRFERIVLALALSSIVSVGFLVDFVSVSGAADQEGRMLESLEEHECLLSHRTKAVLVNSYKGLCCSLCVTDS